MVGAVQGVEGGAQDVELVGTQMGSRSSSKTNPTIGTYHQICDYFNDIFLISFNLFLNTSILMEAYFLLCIVIVC
jgi:hypothetical protein